MVTAYVMVKASTGDVDRLTGALSAIDDGIEISHSKDVLFTCLRFIVNLPDKVTRISCGEFC